MQFSKKAHNTLKFKNRYKIPHQKLKLIIGSLFVLLLVAGVGTGYYLTQKKQDLRQQAYQETPESNPKKWGTLANSKLNNNNSFIKSTFFFAGSARNGTKYYEQAVGPNTDLYSQHPLESKYLHWSENQANRDFIVNQMVETGVNVITMSYWGKRGEDRWAYWAPMQTSTHAHDELFTTTIDKPITILPYIESGASTKKHSGHSDGFSFMHDFPGTEENPSPQLLSQIYDLIDRYLLNPDNPNWPKQWTKIYDQNHEPRYAIGIIHVAHHNPRMTDAKFAQGFQWLADKVYQEKNVKIGFTIDALPAGTGAPGSYKLDPTNAGSELSKQPAVLAIQPFIPEIWSPHKTVDNLVQWKQNYASNWIATGIPFILSSTPGYDAHKVFPNSKQYGHSENWRDELTILFNNLNVEGVMINSWNGFTEGMAVVPSKEHGSVDFNWWKDDIASPQGINKPNLTPEPSTLPITCEHEATVDVLNGIHVLSTSKSTSNNFTEVIITSPIPYTDVEIRITDKAGNVTPYQNPVVDEMLSKYFWVWNHSKGNLSVNYDDIALVEFYVNVEGLGQGGDLCGQHKIIPPGPTQTDQCLEAGESKNSSLGPNDPNYGRNCCPGLKLLAPRRKYDENCRQTDLTGYATTCSDCGNGSCESWENECSCPEDCDPHTVVQNIVPDLDTYIKPGGEEDIHGHEEQILIKKNENPSWASYGFIKFDFYLAPKVDIMKAELLLNVDEKTQACPLLIRAEENSWNEEVHYLNFGLSATTDRPEISYYDPDKKAYRIDVTQIVKDWQLNKYENHGFLIRPDTSKNCETKFFSREHNNDNLRPKLHLVEKTPTEQDNPITWETPYVSFKASDFSIIIDDEIYYGQKPLKRIESDPYNPGDTDYTTLEVTWQEHQHPMRLYMYFRRKENQPNKWEMYDLRTYDGTDEYNQIHYQDANNNRVSSAYGSYDYAKKRIFVPTQESKQYQGRARIVCTDCQIEAFKAHQPSQQPIPNNIDLKLKLAGIPQVEKNQHGDIVNHFPPQKNKQKIKIDITMEDDKGYKTETVSREFSYVEDENGTGYYQLSEPLGIDFNQGRYQFLIKGPQHRQMKFCHDKPTANEQCSVQERITLKPEEKKTLDFTQKPLQAGDLPISGDDKDQQDGIVNVKDYAFIVGCFSKMKNPACVARADLNYDGVVNNLDWTLLVSTLQSAPDQI